MAEYRLSTVSSSLRRSLASWRSLVLITVTTPRSMVSTTSAWCMASRAAHEMASEGVARADGSRWLGRSSGPLSACSGSSRLTSAAMGRVRPMNSAPTMRLKLRWNSTVSVAGSCTSGCMRRTQVGINQMAIATPNTLKSRLPSGTWRVLTPDLTVVMTASRPLPRLAPSTMPSATSSPTTCSASVEASSTTARLEYATTANAAPSRISSNRSLVSDSSISCTAGFWVSTLVELEISRRASSIRPRPISTRPKSPVDVPCREMNSVTPRKMKSGDSHDRSKENTTAIRLVPMSAPSITASAAGRAIRPRPTKEAVMSAVAVLDCTRAVTPRPDSAAVKRLPMLAARIWRRLLPKTRSTPLRTRCVPQTSRAMAARRSNRCFMNGSYTPGQHLARPVWPPGPRCRVTGCGASAGSRRGSALPRPP